MWLVLNVIFKEVFSPPQGTLKNEYFNVLSTTLMNNTYNSFTKTFSQSFGRTSNSILKSIYFQKQPFGTGVSLWILRNIYKNTLLYGTSLVAASIFVKQHFVAASETRELKRNYQIPKRDSLYLVLQKVLTWVSRGHHQTFPSNIFENIILTWNTIN